MAEAFTVIPVQVPDQGSATNQVFSGYVQAGAHTPSGILTTTVTDNMSPNEQVGASHLNNREDIDRLIDTVFARLKEKESNTEVATEAQQKDVTVASHNEAEDVTMVREAMTIVRELLQRKAADGEVDDIWSLVDIVEALRSLRVVQYDEEDDVLEQTEEPGSTEASAEEDENMAFTEETRAELVQALQEANAPVLAALQAVAAAIQSSVATAAEESPVVETPATEAVAEVVSAAPEVPAKAEPVAQASAEETPVAEAAADEAPVVEDAPVAQASTEETGDEEEEESESGEASAVASLQHGLSLHRLQVATAKGKQEWLKGVARQNGIPVGVVESAGAVVASQGEDNLRAQFMNIFRRI